MSRRRLVTVLLTLGVIALPAFARAETPGLGGAAGVAGFLATRPSATPSMPWAASLGFADSGAVDSSAALPPPSPGVVDRRWLRPDRFQHASLSFAIGIGGGVLTDEPAVAFGGAAALGLLKEILDQGHGGFDKVDLVADLIGAGLAALVVAALER